jgi:hypothetical protein
MKISPSHLLAQGQTQGSMLQQCTNKNLTTGPFGNTCKADEVSPKVEAGGHYMTQVSATNMGHGYVITTLGRVF